MNPPHHRATLLTPGGAGAIAVIRLVGPEPTGLLNRIFTHARQDQPSGDAILRYGRIVDGDASLDDVLVSLERVSDTQTAVEICCHGGTQIVHRILSLLSRHGAEIDSDTDTAFDHWRPSDFVEREALNAISNARTVRAARYASRLHRELLDRIHSLAQQWKQEPESALYGIEAMVRVAPSAMALLNGLTVSLIGPPNSGKSTLFNALLGREAVLTSPIAGTTRDWVRESADFDGVPLDVIDTAGHHSTSDNLEREAIAFGADQAQKCDAAFLVLDGHREPIDAELNMTQGSNARRIWVVANKCDLGFNWSAATVDKVERATGSPPVALSAQNLTGCEFLKRTLIDAWSLGESTAPDAGFFTSRQLTITHQWRSNSSETSENPLLNLYRNLAGRADYAL